MRRETEELLVTVGLLVGGLGAGYGPVDVPRLRLEVLTVFDRLRSGLGAIHLLVKHGFAHEAVAIGRQSFTESLMLQELAVSSEEERSRLILSWALRGAQDFRGLFLEAQSHGDDVSEELARVDERIAAIRGLAKRLGVRIRPSTVDEKSLATKHLRLDEYLDFRLSHHFVHGSVVAAEQRSTRVGKGEHRVGGSAAQLDVWGEPAALGAAQCCLLGARALCTIMAWAEPRDVGRLLGQVKDALARFNEAA
jgi:hypothetical protein